MYFIIRLFNGCFAFLDPYTGWRFWASCLKWRT